MLIRFEPIHVRHHARRKTRHKSARPRYQLPAWARDYRRERELRRNKTAFVFGWAVVILFVLAGLGRLVGGW